MEQLEAAKQKAQLDQKQIDRQKLVIQTLTLTGSETSQARSHLRMLEEAQDRLLADMMRILNALDHLAPG
jgi:hypothetical protein